jgi:hypothetical protein
MTLPLLLELAHQGDATAIAVLMNAALKAEKIRVKVLWDEDCLLVMLRSLQPLNQHATIAFIRRGLLTLQSPTVQTVRAYAWHLGQDFPTWIAEFPIAPPDVPVSAPILSNQPVTELPALPAPKPVKTKSPRFQLGFLMVLAIVVYVAITLT